MRQRKVSVAHVTYDPHGSSKIAQPFIVQLLVGSMALVCATVMRSAILTATLQEFDAVPILNALPVFTDNRQQCWK